MSVIFTGKPFLVAGEVTQINPNVKTAFIRVQEREQDENKSLEKCHLNQKTKKITCSPLPSDLFTGGINPQQKPVLLLINDAYKNECDKLLSLEMDNLMDIESFFRRIWMILSLFLIKIKQHNNPFSHKH